MYTCGDRHINVNAEVIACENKCFFPTKEKKKNNGQPSSLCTDLQKSSLIPLRKINQLRQ